MWSIASLRLATLFTQTRTVMIVPHVIFLYETVIGWKCHWMKVSLDEKFIGWKCFGWKCQWMKTLLDESVIGWKRFWMKVSLDENVFGWKCILPEGGCGPNQFWANPFLSNIFVCWCCVLCLFRVLLCAVMCCWLLLLFVWCCVWFMLVLVWTTDPPHLDRPKFRALFSLSCLHFVLFPSLCDISLNFWFFVKTRTLKCANLGSGALAPRELQMCTFDGPGAGERNKTRHFGPPLRSPPCEDWNETPTLGKVTLANIGQSVQAPQSPRETSKWGEGGNWKWMGVQGGLEWGRVSTQRPSKRR